MKRVFLFSVIISLSLSVYAQNTYVLVTGVSRYAEQANNLHQTTKDATSFKAVMDKQTPNVSILTSKYANHDNVLAKLSSICKQAKKNDRVVFYFSGHGFPGGIMAYDNPIYYNELTKILASSAARDKVVYVDACHAGSVVKNNGGSYEVVRAAASQDNMIFFMACRGDEYSVEGNWVGAGYFTQSLLKGLRGKADRNGDRAISVIELFKYVYNDVYNRTRKMSIRQHPQLIAPKNCRENILARW